MTDAIEATFMEAITTTEVYVLMYRYGTHYWDVAKVCDTLEEAQRSTETNGVIPNEAVQMWKIVKVSGLPVEVPDGEARMRS